MLYVKYSYFCSQRCPILPEKPPCGRFCSPLPCTMQKFFVPYRTGLQRHAKNFAGKTKKYFVGMEKGCTFAPAFDKKARAI